MPSTRARMGGSGRRGDASGTAWCAAAPAPARAPVGRGGPGPVRGTARPRVRARGAAARRHARGCAASGGCRVGHGCWGPRLGFVFDQSAMVSAVDAVVGPGQRRVRHVEVVWRSSGGCDEAQALRLLDHALRRREAATAVEAALLVDALLLGDLAVEMIELHLVLREDHVEHDRGDEREHGHDASSAPTRPTANGRAGRSRLRRRTRRRRRRGFAVRVAVRVPSCAAKSARRGGAAIVVTSRDAPPRADGRSWRAGSPRPRRRSACSARRVIRRVSGLRVDAGARCGT